MPAPAANNVSSSPPSIPSSPPTPASALPSSITATPRVSSPLNPSSSSSASSSAAASTASLPLGIGFPAQDSYTSAGATAPIPIPYRNRRFSGSTIRDMPRPVGSPASSTTPPISSPLGLAGNSITPPTRTSIMSHAPHLTRVTSSPSGVPTLATHQRRASGSPLGRQGHGHSPSLGSELELFPRDSFRGRSRSPAQRFEDRDRSVDSVRRSTGSGSIGGSGDNLPSVPLMASAPSVAGWGPGSKANAALGIAPQSSSAKDKDKGKGRGRKGSHSFSASWWGGGGEKETRPWSCQDDEEDEKKKVPEEQSKSWERTRHRVAKAVAASLEITADVTHEALYVGVELLEFAPVPGLAVLARTLLTIWDAVGAVDVNRLACLRLTERCADILLSVREEIYDAGDEVAEEINEPVKRLETTFGKVNTFLQKQVHRPFLKRYLKRDEILREIADCDANLRDAVEMFSVSIQIRILKQVQAAEVQRREDTQRILEGIMQIQLQAAQNQALAQQITSSPRPIVSLLPPDTASLDVKTTLPNSSSQVTISGKEEDLALSIATLTPQTVYNTPPPEYMSPELPIVETIPIQLPVPDVDKALQFPIASHTDPAQPGQGVLDPLPLDTLTTVPPEADVIPTLRTLCLMQNSMDAAHDMVDLRSLLRAALQTSSDAEMIKVLQVKRDEMPEAIKTLQRALEREVEGERDGDAGTGAGAGAGNGINTTGSSPRTGTGGGGSSTESVSKVPTQTINVRVREAVVDPQQPKLQQRHLMEHALRVGNLMPATGATAPGAGGIVEVASVVAMPAGYSQTAQSPLVGNALGLVDGSGQEVSSVSTASGRKGGNVDTVPPTPQRSRTVASMDSWTTSSSEASGFGGVGMKHSATMAVPQAQGQGQFAPPPHPFAGYMLRTDSSRSSGQSQYQPVRRDTLDREFIESGIDALRRMSRGIYPTLPTLPSWTITRYEIDRDQLIGMGFFSDVYKGTWRGKIVAIKVLAETTPRELFIREVGIWKGLKHENVLELFGASSASSDPPWFFVSPYLKRGSLVEWLRNVAKNGVGDPARVRRHSSGSGVAQMSPSLTPTAGPGPGSPKSLLLGVAAGVVGSPRKASYPDWTGWNFPRRESLGVITKERDLLRYMHEIAKGMEYLHSQSVLHGDLKAANVLVDDRLHCVISDFGQSEMKSEAYRISGTPMPHGTLRWQAPELMYDGGSNPLTTEMDVYSFAICCIEVLGFGKMPWASIDDEMVRHIVLREGSRPPIPDVQPFTTLGLKELLKKCWDTDPFVRPLFSKIVKELGQLRRSVGQIPEEMPSPRITELRELEGQPAKRITESPDMRPIPLPGGSTPLSQAHNAAGILLGTSPSAASSSDQDGSYLTTTENSPSSSLPSSFIVRNPSFVGTHNPKNASMPNPSIPSFNIIQDPNTISGYPQGGLGLRLTTSATSANAYNNSPAGLLAMPEPQFYGPLDIPSAGGTPDASVYEFGQGSSSNVVEVPGFAGAVGDPNPPEGDGYVSPPPENEATAEMKNEMRYRMLLSHAFHPSLTLPLWDPSPIQLGDVGYLSKPAGRFVTLFNSFRPHKSAGGLANGLPRVKGYGNFNTGSQRQDKRNAAQRGLDAFLGFVGSKRSNLKTPPTIARTWDFSLRAGHKAAHLYTESTMYRYIDSLEAPKRWLKAHVDQILAIYGPIHHIQKEELFLVIGTLDTPAYGLFVSHHHPDGQGHFHVYNSARAGAPWGTFSIDRGVARDAIKHGPLYNEPVSEKPVFATKVSNTLGSDEPWKTVLVARLRFKPDVAEPTSL